MKFFKELLPHLYHTARVSPWPCSYLNKKRPKREIPVIVSLTTIPSRINIVHYTVRSILLQDRKPKKIVLWLNDNFKGNLPRTLKKLQGETFEIRYSPYTFSHRKLLHSLQSFPKENIVTVDDDVVYPTNFLKLLYEFHKKYPKDVVTHLARQMKFDVAGIPLPYLKWPYTSEQPKNAKFLMPVGVFGVLYPPNVLDKRVFDIDLIMKLSPKSDDLWYKTMSLLNGTTCRVTDKRPSNPVIILGTQQDALKRVNNDKDYKRVQWQQLMKYFNIEAN